MFVLMGVAFLMSNRYSESGETRPIPITFPGSHYGEFACDCEFSSERRGFNAPFSGGLWGLGLRYSAAHTHPKVEGLPLGSDLHS